MMSKQYSKTKTSPKTGSKAGNRTDKAEPVPTGVEPEAEQPIDPLSYNGEEPMEDLPETYTDPDVNTHVPEQSGTDTDIPDWFIKQSIVGK